jgi:beta-N-acetylhexosaminidase
MIRRWGGKAFPPSFSARSSRARAVVGPRLGPHRFGALILALTILTLAPAVLSSGSAGAVERAAFASPSAQQVFAGMTNAQRVGQLLMVGCPSTSVTSTCLTTIRSQGVGSVILDGTSTLSISAEHRITAALQQAAPSTTQLFVATDQEGGLVRRMRGPGFTDYSTALVQGTWYTADLQHWAWTWGTQLRQAGINLDLAPVLDTVPVGDTNNPPIGDLDREYSHHIAVVTTQGIAVLRGLTSGGVDTAVKHFPGLGRVTANTDTDSRVTDTITTAQSAYLKPFAAAIAAKTAFVMMSTAIYSRIDPKNPAAFSSTVVTGLLRTTLGFHGVVISDDLGAAKQVSSYSVGDRAVRFISAGGDMVLTVEPSQATAMEAAILARMTASPTFARQVNAAVLRVLQAKYARGLLH